MQNIDLEFSLINWIKDHAKKRGFENLAFDFTGDDINSALICLLCWQTRLPTTAVLYRTQHNNFELCTKLNTKTIEIYDDTYDEFPLCGFTGDDRPKKDFKIDLANPILSSLSKCLIVGNRDKNSHKIIRNYSKLQAEDILPLANFDAIKIGKCFKFAGLESLGASYQHILNIFYDKRKKEDDIVEIDNFSFTYAELNWLEQLDYNYRLISGELDPTKYAKWFSFTIRQKEIIAKAHQIEKQTRYKINTNIPVFEP